MICENCNTEIPDNLTSCPNCSSTIQNTGENKKKTREHIEIMGIRLPIVCISLFAIILGFGGYITPLLLLSCVLLLSKVKNKNLPSNFLVVFALYAVQFLIETVLSLLAAVPTKIIEWMANNTSAIGTLESLSNVSQGFTNVFGAINGFVSIVFFALYIISVISLIHSDKIRIPIVTNIVKKYIIK